MEVIDRPRIIREQRLQERMGVVSCYFLANQSQATTHAVDVNING
jgi:hypothetical protein